ncbi:hypothetical protein M1116_02800 [Patescibacteria group bacterium]|nr:hypothetical protein [Patescibacteria group bacterium]
MIDYKQNLYSTSTRLIQYLDKQRQNEKTMQTFELVASFLLITFFLVFAIKPAITTIIGLIGEIQAKEAVSAQLKDKINQIVIAQDIFSQVQERYQIIDSALPDRPRYAQAAIQYQANGEKTGVNASTFDVGIQSKAKANTLQNVKSIDISIGDKTNFLAALNFIDALKRNRRLIRLKEFSLQNQNDKTATDSGQLNFSINTQSLYWDNSNQ